ncbi:lysoplasmalogenase [Stenotrophomonas sp. GZD-301]|uniref:lysoplasmalogenase n=1 Tax=Stenotrophomonas sp. GZD-301 TaxID=3404814 RepID=UPI003BB5CE6E
MSPRLRDALIAITAIAAIVGAGLEGDARWLHWLAKPLTTLLIASIVWRATPLPGSGYRRVVLAGMLLSCIGDIALMLPVDAFVPGLVAFLLAHLCYIVAFRAGWRSGRSLWAAAGLLALFAGANLNGLWPLLPDDLRVPVVVYVAVLALMATLALARAGAWPRPTGEAGRSARWAAWGAALFVVSDSVLAWDRFGGGLPLAALCILATYYAAQYCIARSVPRSA